MRSEKHILNYDLVRPRAFLALKAACSKAELWLNLLPTFKLWVGRTYSLDYLCCIYWSAWAITQVLVHHKLLKNWFEPSKHCPQPPEATLTNDYEFSSNVSFMPRSPKLQVHALFQKTKAAENTLRPAPKACFDLLPDRHNEDWQALLAQRQETLDQEKVGSVRKWLV